MKRRDFIGSTLVGLGTAQLAARASAFPGFSSSPFTLGVASGDVTEDSVVLWTRLAPSPLEVGGGVDNINISVSWQLAVDPAMNEIVRRGKYVTSPALAHSVHVDVQQLQPGREYWYRFQVEGYESTTGHTRTLPAAHSSPASIRFATTSCQNYAHGYFVAYQHMVRDRPAFVIHLGDYIYETSFGDNFRRHETETPPVTLDEFRARHALYKTDRDLQLAHANIPFFTMIDNHDAIEDRDPEKFKQRIAAYQAWYEHMPVRGFAGIGKNEFLLHRLLKLGDLAQISLLDARQYRDSKEVCLDSRDPGYGFGNYRQQCEAMLPETRSMLGAGQEQWLRENLAGNKCRWNVLASPGPFLPFRYKDGDLQRVYIGAWDAYPANRLRVLDAFSNAPSGHPLVLSGDVHSFWAVDGNLAQQPAERFPLVEFVSSSISANWPAPLDTPIRENLVNNPQVDYYEGGKRGYLLHTVEPGQWLTEVRAVQDARDRQSSITAPASFRIRHGQPGFSRA